MKTTILLVCLAFTVRACPFAGLHPEGENPHVFDNKEVEIRRRLRRPQVEPESFNGTVAEAINRAQQDVVDIINADTRIGPKFVRLGFHDCVGGCNGCVNLSNPDNDGLRGPMRSLDDTCIFYRDQLTRADCWALAALTAADHMQPDQGKVDYDFLYVGRETCTNANSFGDGGDDETMPSPHFTTNEITSYFRSEFNFTDDETVTIMGAHTLGRLSNGNSGFSGRWTADPEVLDNEFYKLLVDENKDTLATNRFSQSSDRNANGQTSWTRGRPNIFTTQGRIVMLNADMALISDFDANVVNATTGLVDCVIRDNPNDDRSECNRASTFNKVSEYSRDNVIWLQDFHKVFERMMINGHDTSNCDGVSLCNVSPIV